MSGRSGYRKTDRKRRNKPRDNGFYSHVLRFVLPPSLAFAISPGGHGWGVTVGYNSVVFAFGKHPRQCAEFAADFLFGILADATPMLIPAALVQLLPCRAHAPRDGDTFGVMTADLEAIHDGVQRSMDGAKVCSISVSGNIVFRGVVKIPLSYAAP